MNITDGFTIAFISLFFLMIGCVTFYLAFPRKEDLLADMNWVYSLIQLILVLLTVIFWTLSWLAFNYGT